MACSCRRLIAFELPCTHLLKMLQHLQITSLPTFLYGQQWMSRSEGGSAVTSFEFAGRTRVLLPPVATTAPARRVPEVRKVNGRIRQRAIGFVTRPYSSISRFIITFTQAVRDRAYPDLLAICKELAEKAADLGMPVPRLRTLVSGVLQVAEREAAAAPTSGGVLARTGARAAAPAETRNSEDPEAADPAAPSQRSQLRPPELRGAGGSKRKMGGGEG